MGTKKIVKNCCCGGFSLSAIGDKEYLKKKGKEAFFYIQTKWKHVNGEDQYTRIDLNKVDRLCFHTVTKDLGKYVKEISDDYYFNSNELDRDDPALILVVEELGDAADGRCAKLEVVKIPDDVQWHIDDYNNGDEIIREDHRTW